MQQQTAVEWLKGMLENYGDTQMLKISWENLDVLYGQTKRMEENQSDADYQRGFSDGYSEGYDKGMSDYSRF